MNIITFNVNGLRARLHQLEAVIARHDPYIIGLQEIKVNDPEFPLHAISAMGYHVEFHGQKSHYGVALMSKKAPTFLQKGFLEDNDQAHKRLIVADYPLSGSKNLRIINGYFPQGENQSHEWKYPAKRKFYKDLQNFLTNHYDNQDLLAVMGDFNISHKDLDIGIGPENTKRWLRDGKCSFLPEERQWFDTLMNWGFIDCFRSQHPDSNDLFSWFDYRSRAFERTPKRGLRIDGILATAPLYAKCKQTSIDYMVRGMEKPSDHAPVVASFNL